MKSLCTVAGPAGAIEIGPDRPLTIIAGPCALESRDLGLRIGEAVRDACAEMGFSYIFKASYDKANRTSVDSKRGPGLESGLRDLEAIRAELGVPVTTDIHEPAQAEAVAEVVDVLQIPAFLCRQTDLLVAASEAASARAKAVNIKKGQFLSPEEMRGPVRKCTAAGCSNLMLTERGTFFGYHRLVTDVIGLGDLMALDTEFDGGPALESTPPVCFDATHSAQLPGASKTTGAGAIASRCSRPPPSLVVSMLSLWNAIRTRSERSPTRRPCSASKRCQPSSLASKRFGTRSPDPGRISDSA